MGPRKTFQSLAHHVYAHNGRIRRHITFEPARIKYLGHEEYVCQTGRITKTEGAGGVCDGEGRFYPSEAFGHPVPIPFEALCFTEP